MARTKSAVCVSCGEACWPKADGTARCRACWSVRSARSSGEPRTYKAKHVCPVCDGPKWSDGPRPCRRCDHVGSRKPRACEVCDTVYKPTHSLQRTCGRDCGKWLNYRTTCSVEWAGCAVCGRTTTTKAQQGFGTCSEHCANEARRILFPSVERDEAWKHEERECPMCATVFRLVDRGEFMPSGTTYCSTRCNKRAGRQRRRVREAGSYGEWRWSDFMRIARKFGYCCAYCGKKPDRLDPDHVVPLSKGGPNIIGNLLPTCAECNSDKCALDLDEWALSRVARGHPPRHTSWAPEDKRYWHLTVSVSAVAA